MTAKKKTTRKRKPKLPELVEEVVAIEELRPHPRNYREHPEDQLEHIAASIRENGVYRNVVVAKDGTILAGHGVVEAARDVVGLREIPVRRLDVEPDSKAALKVLAGDNESAKLAEVDDRALAEMLREVADGDEDALLGTGYDGPRLALLSLVTRTREEIRDFDEAAEWTGMPTFEPGEDPLKLVVSFRSEEDRDAFVERYPDIDYRTRGERTLTAWWPERPLRDLASVRFEDVSDEDEG